jgi:DNA-binding transcriptional regulator YbjK
MYPFSAALSDMARRCSELEEKHLQSQADSTRRYSDLEEKYFQGQTDLARVSASLDDTRSLNSSLNAQLNSERAAHEVSFLSLLCRAYCLLDAESCFLFVGGETSARSFS